MEPNDNEVLQELKAEIEEFAFRVSICERIFKKMMEFDMRLDTLEFNCDLPVKPGISEKLMDLQLRLETLEGKNDDGENPTDL